MTKRVRHALVSRTGSRRAALAVVVAIAASLVLSTPGGATTGGGTHHSPVVRESAPAVTRGAPSAGTAGGAINPWILNDLRYTPSFLNARTAATTDSVGLVIPDQERTDLIALIQAGASLTSHTTAWTQTGTGAMISQNGSPLLVAAVSNSLDGDGAIVARITLNGNNGWWVSLSVTAHP